MIRGINVVECSKVSKIDHKLVLVASFALVFLAGFWFYWPITKGVTVTNISRLTVGMNLKDVESLFGVPGQHCEKQFAYDSDR